MDNNRLVHVKSGLKEGEHVLLAPPLDEAQADPWGQGLAGSKAKGAATRPAAESATTKPAAQGDGR
jgi:hypothetical protein